MKANGIDQGKFGNAACSRSKSQSGANDSGGRKEGG